MREGAVSEQFEGSDAVEIECRSDTIKITDEKGKPAWRKLLQYIGPGIMISIAFLDPGCVESDLQAGAQYKYELLWIIFVGSVFGVLIQYLAANLGVVTGKHLSQHYREEYPRKLNYVLWILSELAVTTADIPEVVGTALALNMLIHTPIWAGVLIAGVTTLLLIGLQRFGMRKLEGFIGLLLLIMLGAFLVELVDAKPNTEELFKGMFVPLLSGQGATGLAISLIGALITPHNLFLHSALVLTRKVKPTVEAINSACKYFLIETAIALFISFVINVSVTSLTGAVCSSSTLSEENQANCANLDLNKSAFLLKSVLGSWSSILYGIALLASGQSSAVTGTYAGQFIMEGFINLKMRLWLRNLMTRSVAIVPSLVVAIVAGSSGSGKLIIIASMILSFLLPFSMIPLLKFTSSEIKMGPHKNSMPVMVVTWAISWCIIGINIYYLGFGFVKWLIHNSLPKIGLIFIAILVFPFIGLYIALILYLTFRREKKVTYVAPGGSSLPSPLSTPITHQSES